MPTRNNIFYNLEESPIRLRISEQIKLVFSSQLHKTKFIKRQAENRIEFNTLLKNRFNWYTEFNTLADLCLYAKIETRGFLIMIDEGGLIKCQRDLVLYGEKIMVTDLKNL